MEPESRKIDAPSLTSWEGQPSDNLLGPAVFLGPDRKAHRPVDQGGRDASIDFRIFHRLKSSMTSRRIVFIDTENCVDNSSRETVSFPKIYCSIALRRSARIRIPPIILANYSV